LRSDVFKSAAAWSSGFAFGKGTGFDTAIDASAAYLTGITVPVDFGRKEACPRE